MLIANLTALLLRPARLPPHSLGVPAAAMFSLFMGLWEFLFSKAELHLLIVGLDDAGKTVGTFGRRPERRRARVFFLLLTALVTALWLR